MGGGGSRIARGGSSGGGATCPGHRFEGCAKWTKRAIFSLDVCVFNDVTRSLN